MLEATHSTLLEVLEYLAALMRDQVGPAAACERLGDLRSRYPQQSIELVWEEQGFDDSVHYDALVRGPEAMTLSLSVCPDRALPWPLRGVQKSRDTDLLRVNGIVLRVVDAVARLDVLWQNDAVMQSMIDACLIEDALRARTIRVDAPEVQLALDAIRRRRGLHRAADMRAWIESTGASEQTLEQMATDVARATKLRDAIAGERARVHLHEHIRDFDCLSFVQLQMPSDETARTVATAIRSGHENFHEIAERMFLQGRGERMEPYFRRSHRCRLEAALQHALHDAEVGTTVGPVTLAGGTFLVKLLAVEDARMDDRALEAAKTKIFNEWLAEVRHAAKIEWFWGNRQRTEPHNGPANGRQPGLERKPAVAIDDEPLSLPVA
jgi:putative peptide maturation system protein